MPHIGDYGPTIIGVMWTETVLALTLVSMRLWTRIGILYTAGWDDYLISFSWLMLLAYTIGCTLGTLKGFGRHAAELEIEQFVLATQTEIIAQTFCIIGIITSKASVVVFLLRITIIKWHRIVLYFVVFACSVVGTCVALFDFIESLSGNHTMLRSSGSAYEPKIVFEAEDAIFYNHLPNSHKSESSKESLFRLRISA